MMVSDSQSISVIIRTKDRRELLAQAVQSVLTQLHRPIELVVVNDGGQDVSQELNRLLASVEDVQLLYLHHSKSLGRTRAANAGLNAATSPLSIFLDDDDYFDPEHLRDLFNSYNQFANTSEHSNLIAVHSSARAVSSHFGQDHTLSITGSALQENQLFYQNTMPILTVLFPTKVREMGAQFDPSFDLFEDWDFWLQVNQHCSFIFTNQISCAYRIHEQGSGVREKKRQHLAFLQIYTKWLPQLPQPELYSLIAQTHLWREELIFALQSANQAELNRIGGLHTSALHTIQSKDQDIQHLDSLKNDLTTALKQQEAELIRLRLTSPYYWVTFISKFIRKHYDSYKLNQIEEFMNQTIDVIVPVYRGLQDVIDCLDSIKSSTNTQPFELILIDDCSPEPEVSQLLQERAQLGEFTLLVNEQNLGFVATVNRGMQLHPDRDVLLLNSDTLVTNNWLDKITKAAYADSKIGTVTPFSNNATICSYPQFCQDNHLPSNTPLPLLDTLCDYANAGKSVDVPTGVGFCMFIRRACLNELGYFDVETFGKGYGEENDFCQRAIKAGWKNRFALDTFVQHTGNVSFGDEHNELKHTALGKLLKRHPDYDIDVQKHIVQDPAKPARIRTWLASLRFGNQPIVIHVSHNRGGGTARFVSELSEDITNQCYSLCLMPSLNRPGYLALTRIVSSLDGMATEESEYCLYFEANNHQKLLLEVLSLLPLAGFHFHHMVGLPDWVMTLPEKLDQPHLVTLHDYYYLDESISLTDDHGLYRGTENLSLKASWISRFTPLLNRAAACLAPSEACRTIYLEHFSDANIVTQYHEQGRHLNHDQFPITHIATKNGMPLRIVVIGALSKIKGADLLEETAQACAKQGINVEFELIGYSYRELLSAPKANLTVTGRYDESDLLATLKQRHSDGKADLVWFTALWPETYSYTLSAVIESGLPVVAPDIGAFSERLFNRKNSWIVPWQSTIDQMLTVFRAILEHGDKAPILNNLQSRLAPATQTLSYEESYLSYLRADYPEIVIPPIAGDAITEWLDKVQPLTNRSLTHKQKLRRRVLYSLFRLRQLPIMSRIAKRVPLSVQRRINDFLVR